MCVPSPIWGRGGVKLPVLPPLGPVSQLSTSLHEILSVLSVNHDQIIVTNP